MSQRQVDVRSIVREVVREMVAETGGVQRAGVDTPGAELVTPRPTREKVESVRIVNDADLDQFVRRLVTLFENPKNRQDLRAGRWRFKLGATPESSAAAGSTTPTTRIESGAVTERQVKQAAEHGRRLLLGRRAVLTPLAREKARALGVPVEKER